MAKQTWSVDRKKGGTYSFNLDAQGNYTLQKDGFGSVKTLNLPELKKEDTKTTTTTQDTKKISDQTQKAFGDVQPFYYRGGGADSNEQYINEYKIKKDKSLDTDIEPIGAWDRGRWGPKPGDTDKPMTTGDGPWTMRSGKADTTPAWAKGVDKRGYENINKDISVKATDQIGRVNADQVLDARAQVDRFGTGQWGPKPSSGMPVDKTYRSETQKFKERYRPTEIKAAPQKVTVSNTALKAVKTTSNTLSKAFNTTFKTPAMMLVDAIVGSDPIQQGYNQRNKEAFSAVGYKTRGELGSNRDPGRIAGNPADNVFAGMNMVSARGDVMKGARNRIAKRQETSKRLTGEKKERFDKKTQEFKGQVQEVQATKNKQDISTGGVAPGASGGGNGGGNGGGRVICTELHSTGEMSTVDWVRDTRFTFKTLTKSHVKGYLFWAIPTVRHMKKYPLYRKIWKHIAQHRANDIAWRLGESKFDLLGRIYAGIGEPTCWLIGKFVSDKQYNELNLKNWRKA